MKVAVFSLILLICWSQNVESKEIGPINDNLQHLMQNRTNFMKSTDVANVDMNRMLSIHDLWNKIKNSIANAWEAIKDIANKTKEKINIWMQDLKKRVEEVTKLFEARLQMLKDRVNKLIQAIKDTAGDVKQCIQDDKDAIQGLLKQITLRVKACIAESVKQSSASDSYQLRIATDDTEFLKKADDKMNYCVQDVEDSEDCLNRVRGEIYDDMEDTENSIMETRTAIRNRADDALETILQCAADGIIEASAAITEEMLKIVNCVLDEKQKSLFFKHVINP